MALPSLLPLVLFLVRGHKIFKSNANFLITFERVEWKSKLKAKENEQFT